MVQATTPGRLARIRHRLLPITAPIFIHTIFLSGILLPIVPITASLAVITPTGARRIRITAIRVTAGWW